MPPTTHLLVVASRTAGTDELIAYLRQRADAGPLRITLMVPVELGGAERARIRLEGGLERLRAEGFEAGGVVAGDGEPLHAVLDAYDPRRHDEIVVFTLPEHLSRWLAFDLPHRVRRVTGALVRHVEVSPSSARAPAAGE